MGLPGNDDGIHAPGLKALMAAVEPLRVERADMTGYVTFEQMQDWLDGDPGPRWKGGA